MLEETEVYKIKKIQELLNQAENVFLSMDEQVQEYCLETHDYKGSLSYCIQYGIQASQDLIDESGY